MGGSKVEEIKANNIWSGRVDDQSTSLRYHQVIHLEKIESLKENQNKRGISMIGFQCDAGVKRNQGRIGAAQAPNVIREQLASIPYTLSEDVQTVDVGNVTCHGDALEEAQEQLGKQVASLLKKKYTPIILGGGHETFYGHYLGVRAAVGEDATVGLVNIDAHFDLRADALPSSGTMFQQILKQDKKANYFCLGIQPLGNTEALFSEAKKYNCQYILEENLHQDETWQTIDQFAKDHDYLIVTLCMDSIVSSAAPGVSAPSPFGIDPKMVKKLLRYIVTKENTLSFDISEVNPRVDLNGLTSRLAAYIVADVIHHFNEPRDK